jgi:hypothetical protein
MLLDAGAKPELRGLFGETALHLGSAAYYPPGAPLRRTTIMVRFVRTSGHEANPRQSSKRPP